MNYFSVCSGVEAATQAWQPLGWQAVAFSEVDPFPCAVLASRFPTVPNLGDMTKITYNKETETLTNGTDVVVCKGGIDVLVGGTPCQSFSIAGQRKGLEGASGLAYHFVRLLREIRPRFFVWENVPGALSSVSNGQRDFNFLIRQYAECGFDIEWRVLDAQYVRTPRFPRALPQRRRRVFVVGHRAADCGSGCEILLEQDGLRGYPAPCRVKGDGPAGRPAQGSGVAIVTPSVSVVSIQGTVIGRKIENGPQGNGYGNGVMFTLNCTDRHAVAIEETTGCQTTNYVARMITPIECERLQGFADNWTRPVFTEEMLTDKLLDEFIEIHAHWNAINGKPDAKRKTREQVRKWLLCISSQGCPDGHRYKAIGNSMSVNVMEWIGIKISKADRILRAIN